MTEDRFKRDAERAAKTLAAMRAHVSGSAGHATQLWLRPWHDLFNLYQRALTEPPPAPHEWPRAAFATSLNALVDSWAFHSAAWRAAATACDEFLSASREDHLVLDPKSETAGPVRVEPMVPVPSGTTLHADDLQLAGSAKAISAEHVRIATDDGLEASLVDLAAIQPLRLGRYVGYLRDGENNVVAVLQARVTQSVAS